MSIDVAREAERIFDVVQITPSLGDGVTNVRRGPSVRLESVGPEGVAEIGRVVSIAVALRRVEPCRVAHVREVQVGMFEERWPDTGVDAAESTEAAAHAHPRTAGEQNGVAFQDQLGGLGDQRSHFGFHGCGAGCHWESEAEWTAYLERMSEEPLSIRSERCQER